MTHVDGVAVQVVCSGVDERVLLHGDGGAEHFEPFEVLVDGTDPAEVTAAGHGDTGFGAASSSGSLLNRSRMSFIAMLLRAPFVERYHFAVCLCLCLFWAIYSLGVGVGVGVSE